MPITRAALQETNTATAHVDFGDAGDLNIEFYPDKLTYARRKAIAKAAENDDFDAMLEGLLAIFKGWDLLKANGKPEPLTMDVFTDLGESVLAEIMTAIMHATSPKAQTPDSLPDGG